MEERKRCWMRILTFGDLNLHHVLTDHELLYFFIHEGSGNLCALDLSEVLLQENFEGHNYIFPSSPFCFFFFSLSNSCAFSSNEILILHLQGWDLIWVMSICQCCTMKYILKMKQKLFQMLTEDPMYIIIIIWQEILVQI